LVIGGGVHLVDNELLAVTLPAVALLKRYTLAVP
jgi:hypothetical protein